MQKTDLVYMIIDNVMVYGIQLGPDLQGEVLANHLEQFDEKTLSAIAGFNRKFLEHFFILSKGKSAKDIQEDLEKMEKISFMIGPTGSLSYLAEDQVEHILTKLGSLKVRDITEDKVNAIADELLEQQFGSGGYGTSQAFENQLASASFYLMSVGFSEQDMQKKIAEVRQDPAKLDSIFNLQPPQVPQPARPPSGPGIAAHLSSQTNDPSSSDGSTTIEQTPEFDEVLKQYIEQLKTEHTPEREQKITEIMAQIKDHVKEVMTEPQEQVFKLIHPDRLSRALKWLKATKRKSDRMPLLIEWFFCSHLIESIEFKVEHWQVSSAAGHGQSGVYTAGILFSRYDQIVKEFPDAKLAKVVNISRRILETPSKKAIQKLGQDLVAETGFDEHLYFTD